MKRARAIKRVSQRYFKIRKLDALARRVVLARDHHRCRKCQAEARSGRGGGIQCAHILPKGQYPGLRFEIDNLLSMCVRCHLFWWHKNPIEAMEWIVQELGQSWIDRLRLIGRTRRNYDLSAIQLALEMELETLSR